MTPPDLLDLSHHNVIDDWSKVPLIPIVHKVNEGLTVDSQWQLRAPIIAGRHEIFGGYIVLVVARSSIRQQMERYGELVGRHWRDGAFTQLDIEPWPRYARPVNNDEIAEAQSIHDQMFGPDRYAVYMNPNQLPVQYAEWRRRNPRGPLWLPHYGAGGPDAAASARATVHQYTDKHPAPGFNGLVDANHVLDWERLRSLCHLDRRDEPDQPEETDVGIIIDYQAKSSDGTYHSGGSFTLDGIPVPPEAIDPLKAQGWVHVKTSHAHWRAAIRYRNGPEAERLYVEFEDRQDTVKD